MRSGNRALLIVGIVGLLVIGGWGITHWFSHQGPMAANASVSTGMSDMPGMASDASNSMSSSHQEPLTIDPEGRQLAGIVSVPVVSEPITKTIRTVGKLAFNEALISSVGLRFEGFIDELFVTSVGQYVQKGDKIATVYSPDMVADEEEWIRTLAWLDQLKQSNSDDTRPVLNQAQAIVNAARTKLSRLEISDAQLQAIEKQRKSIRAVTIYSPATGYVTDKMAVKGAKLMVGDPLIRLADTSRLWVQAEITEADIHDIHLNQTAVITLSAFPGKRFQAKLTWISPSINDQTRTLPIRFEINNPAQAFKADMLADILISIPIGRSLTIPDSAVIDTGTRQLVYIDKGQGVFEPREIVIRDKIEGKVLVQSGLKIGEKVVKSGTFLIDSEAKLKGVGQ